MPENAPGEIKPAVERPRLVVEIGSAGRPSFNVGTKPIPENAHYVTINLPADYRNEILSAKGEEEKFKNKKNFSSTEGDAVHLPFENGSVDEFILNNFFGYQKDINFKTKVLIELSRKITADGNIIINELNFPESAFPGIGTYLDISPDGEYDRDVYGIKNPIIFYAYFGELGLEVVSWSVNDEDISQYHQGFRGNNGGLQIILKKKTETN